jgi:hypothetical protein
MTSYDNEFNRGLARQQRLYDYAQIANDKYEAHEDDALHGGRRKAPRRKITASDLKDMDFAVYGKGVATLEGDGIKEDFDDALDWVHDKAEKFGKIIETGSKIADTLTGKKKDKDSGSRGHMPMPYYPQHYGYGMSGGDMHGGVRRGAELADMLNPSGSPYIPGIQQPHSIVHAVGSGASARARAQNYRMPGLNVVGSDLRMKGSNFSDNPHQIQAEQAKDGFIGNGMSGGDFFGDLGNIAQTVAPFLPLLGLGMSGGDFFGDLGNIAKSVAPFLPLLGLGRNGDPDDISLSGGDFFSDLGNIAKSVAPFLPLLGLGKNVRKGSKEARRFIALVRALKKNKGMVGKGFFDDFLSGLKSVGDVIGSVAPHVETGMKIYDKFGKSGKGMSGGMTYEQNMNMADAMGDIFSGEGKLHIVHGGRKKQGKQSRENERLAMKISELKGRGAGQYDMPELLGLEDSNLAGSAQPSLGQLASMMGLGLSGGADYGAEEEGISEPLAMAFLGGRHPSKVSKKEKKMLFLKALADAKLHQELSNQMRGRGMSGGALMKGLGLSGGDFWSDFGDGFVKGFTGTLDFAKNLIPFAPLLGLGQSGGEMEGGGRNDYDNSSPAGQFSYGQMGDTAGKANGGTGGSRPMQAFGRRKKAPAQHLLLKPQMKGCSLSGFGMDTERPVGGAKRSAPAGGWIAHVKAYAKQHGCSYKDALSRASATYKK